MAVPSMSWMREERIPERLGQRALTTILGVVLLLLAFSCPSLAAAGDGDNNKGTSQPVTDRAIRLAQTGHVDDAITLLHTFLLAHPSQLDPRLLLAGIYMRSNQSERAAEEYREAVRLHPSSQAARLALAEFDNAAGQLTEAEQVLQEAIRTAPRLASAYQLLALVEAREHKFVEARKNLAIVPVPSEGSARVKYFRLSGSIESGLGDAPAAAKAMEEALRIDPSDRQLRLAAAVAEAQAHMWPACLRNVQPLFLEQPTTTNGLLLLQAQLASTQDFHPTLEALHQLHLADGEEVALGTRSAQLLAESDKHPEAAEEFRRASAIPGSGTELLFDLAVEQSRSGQLDAALASIGQLQHVADSAELEDLTGDIQEQRQDYLAAVHAYQAAVALAPDQERYRLSLGAELLRHESYEAAILVFRQATSLFPKSARVLVGLGMAQFFQESYDDSTSSFLRAVDLGSAQAEVFEYLGMTQLRTNHGPRAEVVQKVCSKADEHGAEVSPTVWCGALMFRRAFLSGDESARPEVIRRLRLATRAAPQSAPANCALGNALAWEQDWPGARTWLENCIRLDSDSAENHYHLRQVYDRLGRKDLAKEQADLTMRAHAERDLRESMAKRFSYQITNQP